MKNKFSFSIESLLYGIENPKGPIAQVLFAKKIAEHEGMRSFNFLTRLTFTDPSLNKAFPGAMPLDETLLLGHEGFNDAVMHLYIRSGQRACKMATAYFPTREITVDDQYRHALILRKLSNEEINQVFTYAWNNLELIRPKTGIQE